MILACLKDIFAVFSALLNSLIALLEQPTKSARAALGILIFLVTLAICSSVSHSWYCTSHEVISSIVLSSAYKWHGGARPSRARPVAASPVELAADDGGDAPAESVGAL